MPLSTARSNHAVCPDGHIDMHAHVQYELVVIISELLELPYPRARPGERRARRLECDRQMHTGQDTPDRGEDRLRWPGTRLPPVSVDYGRHGWPGFTHRTRAPTCATSLSSTDCSISLRMSMLNFACKHSVDRNGLDQIHFLVTVFSVLSRSQAVVYSSAAEYVQD